MKARREFQPGDILTVHRKGDGASRVGAFVKRTKRFLVVSSYSIEAGGELHRMQGDELLIPNENIDLIERMRP